MSVEASREMSLREHASWRWRPSVRGAAERPDVPRGRLVEFVRLIFVTLFAAAGYMVAMRVAAGSPARTFAYVLLGPCTGFVLGGVLGRQTATALRTMEEDLRKVPAAEIVAGAAGLIGGLAVAALLSVPIFRLPALAAWSSVAFMYVTLGYVGFRIGRTKHEDLFQLIGLKPRAAATSGPMWIVDTSALVDGRVLDLVSSGFVSGVVFVHSAVLRELQAIADSSDPRRRGRGRRGLDVVGELRHAPTVDVHLIEEDGALDVDAALVREAKDRGASLLTTDHNLSKVALALGVPAPNVNELASAFRLPVGVGDEIDVHLIKQGREAEQAVAYLEDGTMVVVESAGDRVGSDVSIVVRNVIRTVSGRMVFANLR